eukprot:SAG31_NODE_17806_length_657_cov_1.010753_1_plen_29_part_01
MLCILAPAQHEIAGDVWNSDFVDNGSHVS